MEDFLRRKGETQFRVYTEPKVKPRRFTHLLGGKSKEISGTSLTVRVDADLKIDAISFTGGASTKSKGAFGTLPYHGLRLDMSRSEIEKALAPPDKIEKDREHVIPEWSDATRKAEYRKTTTLIYASKGVEVKFKEQKGWPAGDRIDFIKVKARRMDARPASSRKKYTGKGLEEIRRDMLAAQNTLVAGSYGQADTLFSQAIQDLRLYEERIGANNYETPLGAALYFRGLARIMLGHYEEANENLRASVCGRANDVDDYLLLGISEVFTGRVDRARQRVADLRAARRSEQADKLERNISLHQQGKAMDL